jgi:hypothetical protein
LKACQPRINHAHGKKGAKVEKKSDKEGQGTQAVPGILDRRDIAIPKAKRRKKLKALFGSANAPVDRFIHSLHVNHFFDANVISCTHPSFKSAG